jgi:hypothetical protein
MPVILRYKGFRFFFYSNEGSPREPVHVHIRSGEGEAKFWLLPAVLLENSNGFDARTLRELAEAVEQNAALIERAWNEHFS